ncbi:Transmembrane exosortase (Exosortase_EpsH) [mine drainage metagenome]|uniref:Transmembrane exosortase (Exosortase_EpsH) n=1 Tax=mine drainage metagenome TaxID=410659 RepID=A0A3P3ZQU5_9ZZZZ
MTGFPQPWKRPLTLSGIMALLLLLWFYPVVQFTVHTWLGNETYLHGGLIPFISLWLIWRERDALKNIPPGVSGSALVVFAFFALAWELGKVSNAMIIQQFSLVGMIVCATWSQIGNAAFRQLLFPLLFLFLAVPFGESFIPPLMDFTADFATAAIHLTGIPVYREGNFLTLPTGNWSVVEACSGLRYLIASLTLGVLFAHLAYRHWTRKLLFLLASLIVPVAANGVRAYLIILIGHLSGMKLAVGVDHLIYGWLFFGLVMFLLFWMGSFFREDTRQEPFSPEILPSPAGIAVPRAKINLAPLGILVFLALLPRWHVDYLEHLSRFSANPSSLVLTAPPPWSSVPFESDYWTPHYTGERIKFAEAYTPLQGTPPVTVFIAYYRNQTQGSSLITSGNTLVIPQDHRWGKTHESAHPLWVSVQTSPLPFTETLIRSDRQRRVVWDCYWVDRRWVSSPYAVKAWEAWSVLKGQGDGAAVVVFSTPFLSGNTSQAQQSLQSFSQAMLPEIQQALEHLNQPRSQ